METRLRDDLIFLQESKQVVLLFKTRDIHIIVFYLADFDEVRPQMFDVRYCHIDIYTFSKNLNPPCWFRKLLD